MSTDRDFAQRARFCFVFICQAGDLEIKSLLLAVTLKAMLRSNYELVAAVPGPASVWGEPSADTLAALAALGVRVAPIVNPIGPHYPIGNKLACHAVPTSADIVVFLDSDIVCMRDLPDDAMRQSSFAAKPADLRTVSASRAVWEPIYAAAGVAMPDALMATTVSGEPGPPYFNSGVVFAERAAGLSAAWIECARIIDASGAIGDNRHWLDQISLPVAVYKLGLSYTVLDENYNFPAHLKPVPDAAPIFCHYHWPRVIAADAQLLRVVNAAANSQAHLANLMRQDAEWSALLDASGANS